MAPAATRRGRLGDIAARPLRISKVVAATGGALGCYRERFERGLRCPIR